MGKESFASVLTIAIFCFDDSEEGERTSYEYAKNIQEGLPRYFSKDKKTLAVYNPTFSFVQNIDSEKYRFNRFWFAKLNFDDFSYDIMSLNRNPDWDDAEKIRTTIPYPPKYLVENTVHITTSATSYNELYDKLSEEVQFSIPILEHAKEIKNVMLQRYETVHHENPQMLLQQYFDEKISGSYKFLIKRKLYGNNTPVNLDNFFA